MQNPAAALVLFRSVPNLLPRSCVAPRPHRPACSSDPTLPPEVPRWDPALASAQQSLVASSGLHEKRRLGIRDPTIHPTDALCRGIWPDFEAVVDSAIPCARAVFPAVHRLNASWRPDGTAYSQSHLSSIFDAHVLNHLLRDTPSG